jgi:hypothetical protein
MRRLALGLVWISVAAAAAGFCLPWATVTVRGAELASLAAAMPGGDVTLEIRRDGRAARATLAGFMQGPRTIRGRDIPWLARTEEASVASALLELFTDSRQDVTAKGMAVILVPVAALLAGICVTMFRTAAGPPAAAALACAAVAGVGTWKAAALGRVEPFAITVEEGLVLSVLAYAGLAAAAGWLSVLNRQQRRRA